jgi:hypothetical protein
MKNIMIILAMIVFAFPVSGQNITNFGRWNYEEISDQFTDEVTPIIYSQTFQEYRGSTEAMLSIRCVDENIVLVYVLGGFMGGDLRDKIDFRYRVDNNPASSEIDLTLLSGKRLAYTDNRNFVNNLVREMISGLNIVVQVTDRLDGEIRVHSYSLDGFYRAFERLPCKTSAQLRTIAFKL